MTDRDLDALAPASAKVEFRGETLTVSPVDMRQVIALAREAGPLLEALAEIATMPEAFDNLLQTVLMLIKRYGESTIRAVAIAVRKDEDFIAAAMPDEFIALAAEVARVNGDFFARHLRGQLDAVQQQWARRPGTGTGSTPSNSSSTAATGSTTS